MKKQVVVLVLAAVLVFGCAVGGTLAWLMDTTTPVENVFTAGNVDIDLKESAGLDLKMVPGETIKKDPAVTVKGGSEACYVFVKIDENATLKDFISYDIDGDWTQLKNGEENVAGVYYIEQDATNADVEYEVLANDEVSVIDTVSKAQLNGVTEGTIIAPKLTFTAYAIQSDNLPNADGVNDAYEAWNLILNPAQQG